METRRKQDSLPHFICYNDAMHRILKVLTSRLVVVAVLVILQFVLIVAYLSNLAFLHSLNPILDGISLFLVLLVINRPADPGYKIAWVIALLSVPVIGVPAYILFGNRRLPKKLYYGTLNSSRKLTEMLETDPLNSESYEHGRYANILSYGAKRCGFPVYEHTDTVFFGSGEEWLPVYLDELKKAKHFIFIEMFIIAEGSLWDEVHAVLKQKAEEGVDVKLIYDDFGSVTMPPHFYKQLKEEGIEAYAFNHLRPALIITMNNRDHRKITVIDNQTAFTGGVNLADEYANRIKRFGYWRDSAIMVKGPAVWSMTCQFLGMYHYIVRGDETSDYEKYHLPTEEYDVKGFVQPFADTPTDGEETGLTEHLNIINSARRYLYINSPYLILPDAVERALITAAGNGVDVRVMTPHIPDKKLVFECTRSGYEALLQGGVKIYEFIPGFDHSKAIAADDEIGIVGSINTDYRSYFLHFEDGVMLAGTDSVKEIRKDFEKAMGVSHEVTLDEVKKTNILVKFIRDVLHVFMPLV